MQTENKIRPVSGFPILMGLMTMMGLLMGFFAFLMAAPAVEADDNNFCSLSITNTWPGMSWIPEARIEGQAIAAEGKLWVVGGFTGDSFLPNRNLHMYDPVTNSWTAKASMPLNPSTEIGLSHGGIAYDEVTRTIWIAGGLIKYPTVTNKVWKYHIPTDTWSQGPNLPQARASAPLVKVGRKLYFIGGISTDRFTDYDNNWVLDLDNPTSWDTSSAAPFPANRKRNHASGIAIDGKIYLLGGMFGHNGRYAFNDGKEVDVNLIDMYDPETDTWHILYNDQGQEIRLPMRVHTLNPAPPNTTGALSWSAGAASPAAAPIRAWAIKVFSRSRNLTR